MSKNTVTLLDSPELPRIESLLPVGLRDRTEKLGAFLEDYYRFMNTVGPSATVNSLLTEQDLYEMSDEYLSAIQDEIAAYIPSAAKMDRRTTFKRIVKYFYNMRGSRESAKVFFRIFYDTYCDISDPVSDPILSNLAIDDPSNGIDILNQDAWRPYAYTIRTGISVDEWEKPYRALIHPAGFRFFAAILLISISLNRWDLLKADAMLVANADETSVADVPFLYAYGKFQEFTADSYYIGPVDRNVYHSPASQPGWIRAESNLFFRIVPALGYLGRTHFDYDNMLKFYEPNVRIGDFGSYTILAASTIETGHTFTTAQLPNLGAYVSLSDGEFDGEATINTSIILRPVSMATLNFTSTL